MVLPTKYLSEWYPETPFPLSKQHLALEQEAFGRITLCPTTYEDFVQKYRDMAFCICNATVNGEIIGFKLSEVITPEHYHHRVIVVDSRYRGQGIGRCMSETMIAQLIDRGCRYITLFSIPDSINLDGEGSLCRLISTSDTLMPAEVILLENLERHRRMARPFPRARIIPGYYKYRDGGEGDASIKCYVVDNT